MKVPATDETVIAAVEEACRRLAIGHLINVGFPSQVVDAMKDQGMTCVVEVPGVPFSAAIPPEITGREPEDTTRMGRIMAAVLNNGQVLEEIRDLLWSDKQIPSDDDDRALRLMGFPGGAVPRVSIEWQDDGEIVKVNVGGQRFVPERDDVELFHRPETDEEHKEVQDALAGVISEMYGRHSMTSPEFKYMVEAYLEGVGYYIVKADSLEP